MKKEKEDFMIKREKVRQTLDMQIKDQKLVKQQKLSQVKQMDNFIISKANQELQMEAQKKEDLKQKVFS